tara:strand:- start:7 stop:336 length:330 start_codon:yes stop_codon:yes gene_type:complete
MDSKLTYKSEPINRYEFLLTNLVKPKFEAIHGFKVKSHEVEHEGENILHTLDVIVIMDSKILSTMSSYFQDQWTMSDEEQMGIDIEKSIRKVLKMLAPKTIMVEFVSER